jgi:hypothetical protein
MAENKVEQYLVDLMYNYQEVKQNMWLLEDTDHNLDGIMVMYAEPLVIIRAQVMNIPKQNKLELFTKLLELNAGDLVHGAYGIEGEKVVIIDTLEYSTLDYSEFRATLDAISLAITQHYPILSVYREK